MKTETNILIQEGSEIKHGGASEAFESEFLEMERKLEEVRRILDGADTSIEGLDEIQHRIQIIRQNLTSSSTQLDEVDNQSRDTSTRIEIVNNRIESIKIRIDLLKKNAQDLRDNATKIQELDVTGAFNSVRESYNRSLMAEQKTDSTTQITRRSEAVRRQADDVIRTRKAEFDRQLDTNEMSIRELNITVTGISRSIVDLNQIVCDGRGDPCDHACGGAGCGKCGGISCGRGSVSLSTNALDFSRRAELLLQEKQSQTGEALSQIESAKDLCDMAMSDAQMAYDRAQFAKNDSEGHRADLQRLIEAISEFMNQGGAKPEEIRVVAEEVLAMSISLTPDQIRDLARQIKEAISGLTNIEDILEATRDAIRTALELKMKADSAKLSADDVLRIANLIIELLRKAGEAQTAAETAVTDAQIEITGAKSDLDEIEFHMSEVDIRSNSTLIRVFDLRERIANVKRKFTENEINVERASEAARNAEVLANEADDKAALLESRYSDASQQLELKFNETKMATERASRLKTRASEMYINISSKLRTLQEWEMLFKNGEASLGQILVEVGKENNDMVLLLQDIRDASSFLRTCGTA